MTIYYYLLASLVLWAFIALYLLANTRKISFLKDQQLALSSPSVAIIIAVRNEETDLETALESVCHLNYRNYRVIVVNDRSTDRTSLILDQFALSHPLVTVVDVDELPKFWLGKNNALYQGYLRSDEEWLLFTDADIVFDRNALKKAMYYTLLNELDHLTIFPDVNSRSTMLNSILQTFTLMIELRAKPWDARNKGSRSSMGIGAFNLVSRTAYESAGTHRRIKLRPDDDLQLGRIIKKAGNRQDVLYGDEQITLEWYTSIREFVKGLMKNTFAVSEYNVFLAVLTALSTFLMFALPVPLGLLSGSGRSAVISICILFTHWLVLYGKPGKRRSWDFLTISIAGLVMTYIILRSTFLTVMNNGIYWRDSFYPLEVLRCSEPDRGGSVN